MTTNKTFRTAKLVRDAKFAEFTVAAGSEVEIRDAYFDRNDQVQVVCYADDRRVVIPSNYLPAGSLRGMTANSISI